MPCAWLTKKWSVAKLSQVISQTLAKGDNLYNSLEITSIFFLPSPCSGLVVSGYSKTPTDILINKNIAEVIEPYKKFKRMFKVDTSGDFKGTWVH